MTPGLRGLALQLILLCSIAFFAFDDWMSGPIEAPSRGHALESGRAALEPGAETPERLVLPGEETARTAPPLGSPQHVDSDLAREVRAVARRPRRVKLSALRSRLQPGLCPLSKDAAESRRKLTAHFLSMDWGDSLLYLDPRLPDAAHLPLLHQLEQAENEVDRQLALTPARPDVFVYFDTELLVAASCTRRPRRTKSGRHSQIACSRSCPKSPMLMWKKRG